MNYTIKLNILNIFVGIYCSTATIQCVQAEDLKPNISKLTHAAEQEQLASYWHDSVSNLLRLYSSIKNDPTSWTRLNQLNSLCFSGWILFINQQELLEPNVKKVVVALAENGRATCAELVLQSKNLTDPFSIRDDLIDLKSGETMETMMKSSYFRGMVTHEIKSVKDYDDLVNKYHAWIKLPVNNKK